MSTDDVVDVPYSALEPDTLRRLIEEFVTRDSTDYGDRVRSLESKVADVMRQLADGSVRIVFEPATGAINIVPGADLGK